MTKDNIMQRLLSATIFVLLASCGTLDNNTARVRFEISSHNTEYISLIRWTGTDGERSELDSYPIKDGWVFEGDYARGMSVRLRALVSMAPPNVITGPAPYIESCIKVDGRVVAWALDSVRVGPWWGNQFAYANAQVMTFVP